LRTTAHKKRFFSKISAFTAHQFFRKFAFTAHEYLALRPQEFLPTVAHKNPLYARTHNAAEKGKKGQKRAKNR
jgi:hypothetical protein